MSKPGRFQAQKQSSGAGKKILVTIVVILLVLVLLVGALGGYAYIQIKNNNINGLVSSVMKLPFIGSFLDSKLEEIPQAEIIEQEPVQGLDKLIGIFETTEPPTMDESDLPVETETTEAATEPIAETEPDYGQSGKIVNIMVIGQDSREGEEHKLSDTLILVTLNKETKKLTVTSFLRDSYVDLPDYRGHTCGWNRINTAYALGYGWYGDGGAMEMLNMCIKNNYGVEIDGDVEISLGAFRKIINALGGIDINLEGDELDYMNGVAESYRKSYRFVEGINHLTGSQALWYARMRHANNADSDIKRTNRQRIVVDTVLEKCKAMSIFELNELLDQILPYIITNISVEDMKMYIRELLPYVFEVEFETNQCPADKTYWGEMVELPDGLSGVLKIDFEQNRKLMVALCEG